MKDLVLNTKRIRISINWINWDDFKRKNGVWEEEYNKVRSNVSNLVKEKNNNNSSIIGISYLTEDKETYEDITNISQKAKEIWVDYIQFRPYHHSKVNIIENIERCKKEIKDESFDVLYSKEKYEKNIYDYKIAFADEFRTVIAADWNMYPDCFTRWIKDFCFGNILDSSFDKIWNSHKRKQIIRNKLKQKNCPWQCFQDPLNQFLRDIYETTKEGKHLNFI